ncbi:type II toxin-antitoxin system VapC family toxin [Leptospira sp. 96542]|nr:type II toxin-antitoxin system VapC family toxin [Leptospira sp. 96542]
MIVYLDTSAVIRFLLNDTAKFANFGKWDKQGSSELLEVECHRTFDCMRLQGALNDLEVVDLKDELNELLKKVEIIELSSRIITRAKGSFPVVVRTLDALHLATAEAWGKYLDKQVTVVTHDKQMSLASKSIGLEVVSE